jgi:hypothetical protein
MTFVGRRCAGAIDAAVAKKKKAATAKAARVKMESVQLFTDYREMVPLD